MNVIGVFVLSCLDTVFKMFESVFYIILINLKVF